MSDEFLEGPALVTPEAARDTARLLHGLADQYTRNRMPRAADRTMRDAQWWLTYAIALAQTNKPPPEA